MVSNAALRSNKTSTTQEPESRASKISFVTLNRADSMICSDLKPDWNMSKILKEFK